MIQRLIIEFEDLTIKRTKLEKFLDNNPDCPKDYIELCCKQLSILNEYREILLMRIYYLINENVNIKEPNN